MLNTLLTSIERFHGLVFLATNKPLDIDEAMHRRISRVYMFRPPNCQQRMLLWDSFRSAGLQFSKDIDWNTISMKYELTGGKLVVEAHRLSKMTMTVLFRAQVGFVSQK